MAKNTTYTDELRLIGQYLKSDLNEDAKRQLLFPLFQKLFGIKFKTESAAFSADIYIEGKLIVEAKTNFNDWVAGFYQAQHYAKKGLTFSRVCVIAKDFLGVWKLTDIPEAALRLAHLTEAHKAANQAGTENARKTSRALQAEILDSALFKITPQDVQKEEFSYLYTTFAFLKLLQNLDSDRVQIHPSTLLQDIEGFKAYFDEPIEAIHAFYSIVAYWDVTSTVIETPSGDHAVLGFKGKKTSDPVTVLPKYQKGFTKFVETHYVFTNEGSGLTVDYYFSRFDEVLAALDPEYVRQHGIFFTDDNLSKFALWYVEHYFFGASNPASLNDYIVLDPAGGSGNLVTSWQGHLRHKVVSELQPDLLKIIEKRMRQDPYHQDTGFTIIPKTVTNQGLNFLDRTAGDYMTEIERVLAEKSIRLDKPLAFLLNPPYKSTDENDTGRTDTDSNYQVDQSILAITGEDAGRERYLTFVAQILNICRRQVEQHPSFQPLILIFTPTSWLIPRPTYRPFRAIFDQFFSYEDGFVVTSNEFFKLKGRWPVAFTIWRFRDSEERASNVPLTNSMLRVRDFTELTARQFFTDSFDWNAPPEFITALLKPVVERANVVDMAQRRIAIREMFTQRRFNFYRSRLQDEATLPFVSGFPLRDTRHQKLKSPYGFTDGGFVGFMDDLTPVRLRQEGNNKHSNRPDRVWFRLDLSFIDTNKSKCLNGSPDQKGYCANDLESAKVTFSWYTLTKVFNGNYPIWANQFDLWQPDFLRNAELEAAFYALSFAFGLAENRCVVTRFEANNPLPGSQEIFVDNPLCPTNPASFWSTTLSPYLQSLSLEMKRGLAAPALKLESHVRALYERWNREYCQGQWLNNVGLDQEPYFKYFDYEDFLTPHSGLLQIRKYAEVNSEAALLSAFEELSEITRSVRDQLFRLLTVDLRYFD